MNIIKKDEDRYFVYNGKNSLDFGIHVYDPQILNTPQKKREIIEVPGRNGDTIISTSLYAQSCLKIAPISARSLPYIAFLRYLGTNTMWYLQFHRVCDKLESSFMNDTSFM